MAVVFPEPEILTPPLGDAGGGGGGGLTPFEPGGSGGGGDDDWLRRPNPGGPSLAMIGMIGLIIAISALFGALTVAYLARRASTVFWKPIDLPVSLWVSTLVIGVSSLTLMRAGRAFRQFRAGTYGIFLQVTGALGVGFVFTQAMALRQLADQGVYMKGNPHSSLLYILTVTHGLHLVGGFSALAYLTLRSRRTPNLRLGYRGHLNVLRVSSVYWHFLVILWFVLFGLLVMAQ